MTTRLKEIGYCFHQNKFKSSQDSESSERRKSEHYSPESEIKILGSEKGLKYFIIALLFHLCKKEQWENCSGLLRSVEIAEALDTRWLT